MMFWLGCGVVLAVGYLLGSIPTGYLLGRALKGIDIREHGSKSTGATNVLRVLGKGPGAAALLVDVLKGAAAVLLAGAAYRWLCAQPWAGSPSMGAPVGALAWTPWIVCLAGLAALLGHARPVWLGFAGGKSVAAGIGLLFAIAWPVALGAVVVFLGAMALWRRVSLGSMLGAVAAMAVVCALPEPLAYRLLVIAGGLGIIILHRANIGRLLAGTEPRLGQRV